MSVKKTERHHNLPFSRGGENGENIIVLTQQGHHCLHSLFGFKTLLESASELRKWDATKGMFANDFINCELFKTAYRLIFQNKTFLQAAKTLEAIDASRDIEEEWERFDTLEELTASRGHKKASRQFAKRANKVLLANQKEKRKAKL